jgi:formate-dependent nitrite reductase membrane component NrfD
MAEHFVRPPDWAWYILGYFFFGGLSGGAYALATLLRLVGMPRDEPAARTGFLAAFVLLIPCPILLTIDLGRPLRFWHMLVATTPGAPGVAFKYWSPMSVGSWVLLVYGIFAFVSFLEALGMRRRAPAPAGAASAAGAEGGVPPAPGPGMRLWNMVGALLGLFLASYTGVLLSVSNQPIWSDAWSLGGLFLASSLGGAAALLAWLIRGRAAAEITEGRLYLAERYFAILELALIALFFVNVASAGMLGRAVGGPWGVLWAVVILSLIPPIAGVGAPVVQVGPSGAAAVARTAVVSRPMILAGALLGVLLMRLVVLMSAQF